MVSPSSWSPPTTTPPGSWLKKLESTSSWSGTRPRWSCSVMTPRRPSGWTRWSRWPLPAAIADALMPHIHIPVIGIGAGIFTDGQVLVFHDLLGMTRSHVPKFVKRYAEIHDQMVAGVRAYAEDVRSQKFPDADHVYV